MSSSGKDDLIAAMRLQAYALLLNAVPEPVRSKVLGQIVKELNLPITLDELKATGAPAPFVPQAAPMFVLCPFCHDGIKVEKVIQSHEEFIDKVKDHLPSCMIVEAMAVQVASKVGRSNHA